ncbi:MAG: UbiA prenyltransferase family protein [Alphaproteobacteria bacterium]|nr:UbiA prenyltransferase family protein [Alphaproteobacteria bacterium]
MNKNLNTFWTYVKIARPDHWIKQLFIFPGCFLAFFLNNTQISFSLAWIILCGFISTNLIASANYVINEYLDAKFDKFHPIKCKRPLVSKNISPLYILLEYVLLLTGGLLFAYYISPIIFKLEILLTIMGIIYNVQPIRSKDIPFLDVLSESFNMAIRLLIGWFLITTMYLPPISIILGYWFAGSYLMAVKRYSEYKMINNKKAVSQYRKSFKYYTEHSLLLQSFFYALISVFFIGIFLIKYKIELILVIPFICILFCYYFYLSFSKDSATQSPEKLYKEKFLIIYIFFISLISIGLLFAHIPHLHIFLDNKLIGI